MCIRTFNMRNIWKLSSERTSAFNWSKWSKHHMYKAHVQSTTWSKHNVQSMHLAALGSFWEEMEPTPYTLIKAVF